MRGGIGGSELGCARISCSSCVCKVMPKPWHHRPGCRSGWHLEFHLEEPQHCSWCDPQTWAAFTGGLESQSSNPLYHPSMWSHHRKSRCDRWALRPTVHSANPCRLQTFAPRRRDTRRRHRNLQHRLSVVVKQQTARLFHRIATHPPTLTHPTESPS
jgi:hypothetical protein